MRSVVGAFCPGCRRELFLPFFEPVFEPLFDEVVPECEADVPGAVFFFAGALLCAFDGSADTPSPAARQSSRAGRMNLRLVIVISLRFTGRSPPAQLPEEKQL